MTEEEWLATRNGSVLLKAVNERKVAGQQKRLIRQCRLMACATFRIVWEQLPDEVLRAAVVTAERYADGECDRESLFGMRREVAHTAHWLKSPYVEECYQLLDPTAHRLATKYRTTGESDALCGCIRDIFGNPFRPVAFDPAWRTSTAVALAKGMYETRDFAAMPILADALQDAGCEDAAVLDHCRDPNGIHARGCWVVDLVIGKA